MGIFEYHKKTKHSYYSIRRNPFRGYKSPYERNIFIEDAYKNS